MGNSLLISGPVVNNRKFIIGLTKFPGVLGTSERQGPSGTGPIIYKYETNSGGNQLLFQGFIPPIFHAITPL